MNSYQFLKSLLVLFCQNPNLNFKEVTYELDHAGFMIRDSKGLQIVVYGIQRGLGMEVFPVDLIYRPWKHAEGQVKELNHQFDDCILFCVNMMPLFQDKGRVVAQRLALACKFKKHLFILVPFSSPSSSNP